jgi:hypothetical protein
MEVGPGETLRNRLLEKDVAWGMSMADHRRTELAELIDRALVSGTVASMVSSAALAALALVEGKKPARPLNSTSHVVWGDEAGRIGEIDLRHSVTGYLIHHASAVFWAIMFEGITRDTERSTLNLARNAAATMATAGLLDYGLLPKRLTPGFERVLSSRSTVIGLAALAGGLVIGGLLARHRG